jgi:hypothetical protein
LWVRLTIGADGFWNWTDLGIKQIRPARAGAGIVPKLHCPCDYVHNLTPIPDAGWVTIPDRRYEEFIDAKVAQEQIGGGSLPPANHPQAAEFRLAQTLILACLGRLYCCPTCGRLMWKREGSQHWEVFTPEPQPSRE